MVSKSSTIPRNWEKKAWRFLFSASATRSTKFSFPVKFVDSLLTSLSPRRRKGTTGGVLHTRSVDTPVGCVRVFESGSTKPCVVFVPDGPNVIEHYDVLIGLVSKRLRVVCFDMPGFGYSFPQSSYGHSMDQGARAVLGVLDNLGIKRATLAFSRANCFYAGEAFVTSGGAPSPWRHTLRP